MRSNGMVLPWQIESEVQSKGQLRFHCDAKGLLCGRLMKRGALSPGDRRSIRTCQWSCEKKWFDLTAVLHTKTVARPFITAQSSLLYTLHSTFYSLHFALSTFHFPLYTPHSTLDTLHFAPRTPHSTLYPLHFTLHTLHFTLRNPHFTLYTLHSPPNTPLFSHSTLRTPPHLILHSLHRYGHRARIYKTGEIKCFIKLFTWLHSGSLVCLVFAFVRS